jgi:preprotein translocase subunit SecB
VKESNFKIAGKPKLIHIQFETNKEYEFEDAIALEINNNINVIRNSEGNPHQAIVTLTVGVFMSKELKEVPFKIEMGIEGSFTWDEELQKKSILLDNMLKQNSPAILYSYLRPLFTMITAEADMPPLVIPLMNFVE